MKNNNRYTISLKPVSLFLMAFVWINSTSLLLRPILLYKNETQAISSECNGNYCVFLPTIYIYQPIPEIDPPPCRWPHTPNQVIYIPYKWGGELQSPESQWRIAFQDGLYSWTYSSALVVYYRDDESANTINTYYEGSGNRGITYITCNSDTHETIAVRMWGNLFYDNRDNYTIEQRRGIATHEVGHGTSIGHIPNWWPFPSLMYRDTDPEFFQIYYDPQQSDIDLVDQIYP